jgi:hypothetical protein
MMDLKDMRWINRLDPLDPVQWLNVLLVNRTEFIYFSKILHNAKQGCGTYHNMNTNTSGVDFSDSATII